MNYPGSKNGEGVYQAIINQIPPHEVYIEPFLGSGAILRKKRPAAVSLGVDVDLLALREFEAASGAILYLDSAYWSHWRNWRKKGPHLLAFQACGLEFLRAYQWEGSEFVYADPPYLKTTRKGGRLYRHEFMETREHEELLYLLRELPCPVAISGYASELYSTTLSDWRLVQFPAMTRAGVATESLWCNYPEPNALHDYAFLGSNKSERQAIKRKRARWIARLKAMSPLERQVMMAALSSCEDER